MSRRTLIIGGPFTGKSTMAPLIAALDDAKIYCSDPRSKARDPQPNVTYLPEGLPWGGDGGAADYVAKAWLPMPGPWVLEGHAMARALARWLRAARKDEMYPCDRIIVLASPYVSAPGYRQVHWNMHRAVMAEWGIISHHFTTIAEVR